MRVALARDASLPVCVARCTHERAASLDAGRAGVSRTGCATPAPLRRRRLVHRCGGRRCQEGTPRLSSPRAPVVPCSAVSADECERAPNGAYSQGRRFGGNAGPLVRCLSRQTQATDLRADVPPFSYSPSRAWHGSLPYARTFQRDLATLVRASKALRLRLVQRHPTVRLQNRGRGLTGSAV